MGREREGDVTLILAFLTGGTYRMYMVSMLCDTALIITYMVTK